MPITNNILIDSGTTKLLFPPDDIKLLINKFDFFGITCKTVKGFILQKKFKIFNVNFLYHYQLIKDQCCLLIANINKWIIILH